MGSGNCYTFDLLQSQLVVQQEFEFAAGKEGYQDPRKHVIILDNPGVLPPPFWCGWDASYFKFSCHAGSQAGSAIQIAMWTAGRGQRLSVYVRLSGRPRDADA